MGGWKKVNVKCMPLWDENSAAGQNCQFIDQLYMVFLLASAWILKYKSQVKKTTQKSEDLRKI